MRKEDDLLSGLSQSGAVVNSKSSWPMFSGMPTKREMRPDTEFTDLNKKHDMKKTFFRKKWPRKFEQFYKWKLRA